MHLSDLHAHADFHHIIESRAQRVAHLVLNRPAALNALSKPMMERLADIMFAYEHDPHIACVLLSAKGERAFCAGGDLRAVYNAQKTKDFEFLSRLFAREYTYNLNLYNLSKPHISFIHGIVMGGGVGASVHGSHRIMCETTTLAMPETAIGYFPDVGTSRILNNAPGYVGLYLALTGTRISAADALYCGFGTHYIPQSSFLDIERQLLDAAPITTEAVDGILAPFTQQPPTSSLQENALLIDACFSAPSVEEIFSRLAQNPHPFCQETLSLLLMRSPISLLVTFSYLKRAHTLTFQEAMALEYTMSQNFVRGHDFMEGIRAAIIDKDKKPAWQYVHVCDTPQSEVDAYFSPLPFSTNLPYPLNA